MTIAVYSDAGALSRAAAQYVVQVANESIVSHGRFTIALSGGSTPRKLFTLLANEPYRSQINWELLEVFWADERNVPADDPESNYHLAQETLLRHVPIPANQIHRAPTEETDREAAAHKYELEIKRVFGTDGIPSFDLIQLGMGPEGHTASLFPHQPSLHESQRLIMPVTVPKPPPPRLTFTPPLINAARHIQFLITGAEKADTLQAVLEGPYQPDEYPAQIVRPPHGEVTWMLDTTVAAKLQKRS
jgi:6-phosphogluconolactonase